MATKLNKIEFSGKKKQAAEMLASPEFNGNISDLCKTIEISRTTLYDWMNDTQYVDYVTKLIDKYTDSELATVWKSLIMKCKSGDTQAIKLYFELKGRYRQNINVNAEIKQVIFNNDDNIAD